MKKVLLALLCAIVLSGCGGDKKNAEGTEQTQSDSVKVEERETKEEVADPYESEKLVTQTVVDIEYKVPELWDERKTEQEKGTLYTIGESYIWIWNANNTRYNGFSDEDKRIELEQSASDAETDFMNIKFGAAEWDSMKTTEKNNLDIEGQMAYRVQKEMRKQKENYLFDSVAVGYRDSIYVFMLFEKMESETSHGTEFESLISNISILESAVGDEEENIENTEQLPDHKEITPYFSYSGSGDDVISVATTDGVSFAHIVYNGDRHFAVKGYYGDEYDLLVNTIGAYDGNTLIYPNQEYTFEVTAKGEWKIDLHKLGASSIDTFSGNGDFVTPIFEKTSNVYEIATTGDGHFSIRGWTDSGYDLLVNTTDENYSGKVMFNSDEQYAFFEITASRNWEIKPVN